MRGWVANEARSADLAINNSSPRSVSGIIVLLELFLDLADFALQEQPEGNLMLTISRAWYNGSNPRNCIIH